MPRTQYIAYLSIVNAETPAGIDFSEDNAYSYTLA